VLEIFYNADAGHDVVWYNSKSMLM